MASARTGPALGGLYLAQGFTHGVLSWYVLPYLAAQGTPLEVQAGVLAGSAAPFVVKAGWAVALDRVAEVSRLRHLAAASGLVLAAVATALGWAVAAAPGALIALAVAHGFALSLQDVSADALALRGVPSEQRGRANAWMVSGHHLGHYLLAGVVLVALASKFGLATSIATHGVALGVLALAPYLARWDEGADERAGRGVPGERGDPWQWLVRPRTWLVAGTCLVVLAADYVTSAVSSEFLVQHLGWEAEDVSARLVWPTLAGFVGAGALASRWLDRWRAGVVLARASAMLGLIWVAMALAEPLWTVRVIQVSVAAQAAVTAWLMADLYRWLMAEADGAHCVTVFAVWMGLLNLSRVVAAAGAAGLLDVVGGFAALFLAAGMFQALLFVPLRHVTAGARVTTEPPV